ncbi:MAG TPA: TetR/AcrR family transcriptional regulator [Bacilli bacterium]|nr:TetR/AcrR family transcriptional regulator [Bacilli bacterium]
MAKQTFLNLSEEKRKRIIVASKKEFSRASLKDAVVSNIVKDSDIPRGSFYQYFENLDDCFYYLVGEYSTKIKKQLLENLVETKGDIIKSYRMLYIYILDIIDNKENKEYFEKIFLNMNYETERMFTPNFNDGLNMMLNQIDITKLNVPSKFSLGYVLDIIESLMMSNIVKSYKRNLSRQKNIEIFEKELVLVCNGIVKK